MKPFSILRINSKSPYQVTWAEGDFEFYTANGLHYNISFMQEPPIGGCETYQIIISKLNNIHAPLDINIKGTILTIIDEFFLTNEDVLLYICDTSDGREATRNRLFLKWFEEAEQMQRFTIRTASSIIEGEGFYAAIIVENRNIKLQAILEDFERTAKELSK